MIFRLDRPGLSSLFSRQPHVVWTCTVLLAGLGHLSCTQIDPVSKLEFKGDSLETDNIMPNAKGFSPQSYEPFYMQGGWYWYDSGFNSWVDEVFAIAEDHRYYWLSENQNSTENNVVKYIDEQERTEEIHISGKTVNEVAPNHPLSEYITLGFEVCSPASVEQPYEFPFPFGLCELAESEEKGVQQFRGVRFTLETTDFVRLDVLYKEWDAADDDQPYCVFVKNEEYATNDEIRCDAIIQKTDKDSDTNDDSGTIDVLQVSSLALEARSPDPKLRQVNLSMLQAIHFQVWFAPEQTKRHFVLKDLTAIGRNDDADYGKPEKRETACDEMVPPNIPPSFDPEWVKLPFERKDDMVPFEIMKKEVTVAQYIDCVNAGVCQRVKEWEACNAYEFEAMNADGQLEKAPEVREEAVNCVTWCDADHFCSWLDDKGRLPSAREWEFAAIGNDSDLTYPVGVQTDNCTYIVMNDEEKGVGCGSRDRKPWVGCKKWTKDQILCDMAGNLWEWVSDDVKMGSDWKKGYKKLKGGSMNSTDGDALKVSQETIEHPKHPHNPTRLGFRCIRETE